MQKKLSLTDEQQRYRRLSDDIEKERELLRKRTAESVSVLQDAQRDAVKIRDDARQSADRLLSVARQDVDALYEAYGHSPAGRRQKDSIKMDLLKRKYPAIDDALDSEAGREILKRGRSRVRDGDRER